MSKLAKGSGLLPVERDDIVVVAAAVAVEDGCALLVEVYVVEAVGVFISRLNRGSFSEEDDDETVAGCGCNGAAEETEVDCCSSKIPNGSNWSWADAVTVGPLEFAFIPLWSRWLEKGSMPAALTLDWSSDVAECLCESSRPSRSLNSSVVLPWDCRWYSEEDVPQGSKDTPNISFVSCFSSLFLVCAA